MPYSDPNSKTEHNRTYYEQNLEAIRERKRRWYQQNKQRLLEKQRLSRFEEKEGENLREITSGLELAK